MEKFLVKTAAAGLLLIFAGAVQVFAHGVVADYKKVPAIEIVAAYDNGSPMAGGQVTVYAPDDPAQPWLRATLDEQGTFSFVPDHSIAGNWSVQVRETGHGAMIHIPVDESGIGAAEPLSGREFSSLQKAVIVLSVVWGSVGTALFFSRRKK